jgi:hypothetical protein
LPEPAGDERLDALNALVNADTEFDDFFRDCGSVEALVPIA